MLYVLFSGEIIVISGGIVSTVKVTLVLFTFPTESFAQIVKFNSFSLILKLNEASFSEVTPSKVRLVSLYSYQTLSKFVSFTVKFIV